MDKVVLHNSPETCDPHSKKVRVSIPGQGEWRRHVSGGVWSSASSQSVARLLLEIKTVAQSLVVPDSPLGRHYPYVFQADGVKSKRKSLDVK